MTQNDLLTNNSPRLDAPGVSEAFPTLKKDLDADVVVVGGGIAGVMTAFYVLRHTLRSVTLLEGNKIAQGATGHNAGQIDVFFEKPIAELISTYGRELTKNAYAAMFDAREKIEEIITLIGRQGYYTKYIGYNVYTTKKQIDNIITQLEIFSSLGLEVNELFLREDRIDPNDISVADAPYVNRISAEKGSSYLGSEHMERVGFEATHYATLNSAALCHAIISYLQLHYPDRFSVYEHAHIDNITTEEPGCMLTCGAHRVQAKEIVLATNAFKDHLINNAADALPIESSRGYMAGYIMNDIITPKTICYEPPEQNYMEGYYYQTARHYVSQDFTDSVLLTLGGPEENALTASQGFPEKHKKSLDEYVDAYYNKPIHARYYRWGDMAYTDTGMRKVGPHPEHLHLRYNLGCNGVGILSSVHGGWKIAEYLNGNVNEESVFDT